MALECFMQYSLPTSIAPVETVLHVLGDGVINGLAVEECEKCQYYLSEVGSFWCRGVGCCARRRGLDAIYSMNLLETSVNESRLFPNKTTFRKGDPLHPLSCPLMHWIVETPYYCMTEQ